MLSVDYFTESIYNNVNMEYINKSCTMGEFLMSKKYILALNQGTTSSRAIIFDRNGVIISSSQKEFKQIYPHPGWIEHDPVEIWETQLNAAIEAIRNSHADPSEIA